MTTRSILVAGAALAALLAPHAAPQRIVANGSGLQLPIGSYRVTLDADGDGDVDLVRQSDTAEPLELLLNDGFGNFEPAPARFLPHPNERYWNLAAGDIDGDGDVDLIGGGQAAFLAPALALLTFVNDGTGTFTPNPTAFALTPTGTNALRTGDLDGDGDLDLVHLDQDRTRTFLNRGDGTFADVTATHQPPGGIARLGSLVDIDGDGDLDFGGVRFSQFLLWQNDGSGRLTALPTTRVPSPPVFSGIAFDADADGDQDLVLISNDRRLLLFINDGAGTFVPDAVLPVTDAALSHNGIVPWDLDEDGHIDLVERIVVPEGTRLRVLRNEGDSNWSDWTAFWGLTTQFRTDRSLIADLDGDGSADLLFSSGVGGAFMASSDGALLDATGRLIDGIDEGALGDLDGDGDLDVVGARSGSPRRAFLNRGNGTFVDASAQLFPDGERARGRERLVDVDLDGDLDLWQEFYGLYEQTPDGRFVDRYDDWIPAAVRSHNVVRLSAVFPIDGAGSLAALYTGADANGRYRYLLERSPSGTWIDTTAARFASPPQLDDPTLAEDFDGDGDVDLLGRTSSGGLELWLQNPTGTFEAAPSANLPAIPFVPQRALDLDADGDLDCLWLTNPVVVLRNDGNARFTEDPNAPLAGTRVGYMVEMDADRDGDLDLMIAERLTGGGFGWALLERRGGDLIRHSNDPAFPQQETRQLLALHGAGDLDGDGDPDVLTQTGPHFNTSTGLYASSIGSPGNAARFVIQREPGFATATATGHLIAGIALAPQPIELPFGTVFLDPILHLLVGSVALPAPEGRAPIDLPIPTSPTLQGVELPFQALLVDATGADVRLTTWVALRFR